ncbi:FAD-dependent oxidoreductase [Actinoalloteichus sp. AHMU CJ021]|uniref:2-polyprenyl-6-methoxyphenol hydroxylase n=1 Tax=Actinoalloteichus caeruleus DSM 43889 TaxID=1120930 RepID=A0ABT1JIS4_ACTCY|nr:MULTISPECIES: FAD-dependent oxidoreductase [Actinoalloteichus]AUS78170.1 FAD-dependent oxidoreductase [Actinoalloteichus sp. AHMU CJ021]MCP2332194.1 2-polyprenyl-6-methoxyphenol hydroxylase [Actinoalloteichus caeruleus DSM 43889]
MTTSTVLIAGGGPAGMTLGLLLARAGIQVTVLEKHADFLRDFRGDTVHPSTQRLLDELGLGDAFRALPQTPLGNLLLPGPGGDPVTIADFTLLRGTHREVRMVPQWDLLNLLAEAASQERTFTLRRNTEVIDLVRSHGKVAGVRYRTSDGEEGVLHADLTVACDGRASVLRRAAGLRPVEYPVPLDAWWFRLPRTDDGTAVPALIPRSVDGAMLLVLAREGFQQLAFLAAKGRDPELRAEGVEAFRRRIAAIRPDLAEESGALRSMDDVHLLDVKLNRLRRWSVPGLLCIGDAAHAMSPAGGVGINLAVQDAVATARLLADPLRRGHVTPRDLASVQRRRRMPTVVIQALQRVLHRSVIAPAFSGRRTNPPRPLVAVVRRVPAARRALAALIGFGPRPERAPAFARR